MKDGLHSKKLQGTKKEEIDRKPNIGLSDKKREGVANILSTLLSDEYVLCTKTRNYHWNVV